MLAENNDLKGEKYAKLISNARSAAEASQPHNQVSHKLGSCSSCSVRCDTVRCLCRVCNVQPVKYGAFDKRF